MSLAAGTLELFIEFGASPGLCLSPCLLGQFKDFAIQRQQAVQSLPPLLDVPAFTGRKKVLSGLVGEQAKHDVRPTAMQVRQRSRTVYGQQGARVRRQGILDRGQLG